MLQYQEDWLDFWVLDEIAVDKLALLNAIMLRIIDRQVNTNL
jgi:hypothetical protein